MRQNVRACEDFAVLTWTKAVLGLHLSLFEVLQVTNFHAFLRDLRLAHCHGSSLLSSD